MSKKNESGEAITTLEKNSDMKNFSEAVATLADALSDLDAKNRGEKVKILRDVFGQYGLKLVDGKNFNTSVEQLRAALANLGLKIIEDINVKRVQKPEEVYNALVSIYNAIK